MGIKSKQLSLDNNNTVETKNVEKTNSNNDNNDEPTKPKRGRKSKKELLETLQNTSLSFLTNQAKNVVHSAKKSDINDKKSDINDKTNNNTSNVSNTSEPSIDNSINLNVIEIKKTNDASDSLNNEMKCLEEPKISKKRGRKPKGGKIVQFISQTDDNNDDKPNVILHLKCSTKDLNASYDSIESYNFNKNELNYEVIKQSMNLNTASIVTNKYENDDYDDEDDTCKDATKEIWKKIKQLEHNLHINNVNNKRSCCFWDTCEFDNPPIYIPKHFINNTYHVYGCFCSPECGVAYLMNESLDSSTKFERYHLFNNIYSKIYNYKKNIKPAPNPYYMLEKFYGNLTIQDYRSLLQNDRLFLIVDKPLTRILPELHEDNDDFILNNKIIPSNNYQSKSRLQRKKPNKATIVNEKFGSIAVD